jgi:thioredoxin reductase (NADPH)
MRRQRRSDLVVVGAGAAGVTAALHVAAAGYDVTLLEQRAELGGEAAGIARLDAVPGSALSLSGAELFHRAWTALKQTAVDVRTGVPVMTLRPAPDDWQLILEEGGPIHGRVVLVASGAGPAPPDVPGSREFSGAGVYLGVPRNVPATPGDDVFVTGDASAAAEAALRLAAHCRNVVLLSPEVTAGTRLPAAMVRDIRAMRNITVRPSVDIVELVGVGSLEAIVLRDRNNGRTIVRETAALFVAGPKRAQSLWLVESGALRSGDMVLTATSSRGPEPTDAWPLPQPPMPTEASLPGVFAAGAVRAGCEHGVVAAIADGVTAARDIIGCLNADPEALRPVCSTRTPGSFNEPGARSSRLES